MPSNRLCPKYLLFFFFMRYRRQRSGYCVNITTFEYLYLSQVLNLLYISLFTKIFKRVLKVFKTVDFKKSFLFLFGPFFSFYFQPSFAATCLNRLPFFPKYISVKYNYIYGWLLCLTNRVNDWKIPAKNTDTDW